MKRRTLEPNLIRANVAASLLPATFLVCASAQTTQPATSRPVDQPSLLAEPVRSDGPLNDREMSFHVLNRLAFGPTPGLVDRVIDMGCAQWIHEQLRPGHIDDSDVERAIREKFPSLHMSMENIFATYRPEYPRPHTTEQTAHLNTLRGKIHRELSRSVVYRAVHSRRQFNEVIVEFWRNHFNVDQNKGNVGFLANHYEVNVIRRHAFGYFRDMVMASAQHPAMLIYLDNSVSRVPLSPNEQRIVDRYVGKKNVPRLVKALRRRPGLNENYARELMELHTLGVAGPYTQADVTNLARLLTGWTARWSTPDSRFPNAPRTYGFVFDPDWHDTLEKRILGVRIPRNRGLPMGESVVRRLAAHPSAEWFISAKLCRYLVSDNPSRELVTRVTREFHRTKGFLPKVYEFIIEDPEFASRDNFRGKFKTPFEFVVSAVRSSGARVTNAKPVLRELYSMGQPIYRCLDPTGYYDQAEAWLDPGVLVHRWAFALRLSAGAIPGVELPDEPYESLARFEAAHIKDSLVHAIVPGGVDRQTTTAIDQAMEGRAIDRRFTHMVLGLILGSPTFQQQ